MPSVSVQRGTEMESKHMIGESNTDWNKVLDYVRCRGTANENPLYVAAIQLVERMAKGELVERSESIPTFKERAYKVAHECWDKKEWSINTMELRDVLMAECQAAFAAGAASKQPTPPAPVCQDEREHCARVVEEYWKTDAGTRETIELLLSERAAVRAECEARLTTLHATALELRGELERAWDNHRASTRRLESEVRAERNKGVKDWEEEHTKLQFAETEIERLKTRVRELEHEIDYAWKDRP